jgi:uncharacterized protein YfaP (DUF2135 family)
MKTATKTNDAANVMLWETATGKWDVIVVTPDGAHVRITCYDTEAEATKIMRQLEWNVLSVVRCL